MPTHNKQLRGRLVEVVYDDDWKEWTGTIRKATMDDIFIQMVTTNDRGRCALVEFKFSKVTGRDEDQSARIDSMHLHHSTGKEKTP